jgi:hypothetical protein
MPEPRVAETERDVDHMQLLPSEVSSMLTDRHRLTREGASAPLQGAVLSTGAAMMLCDEK